MPTTSLRCVAALVLLLGALAAPGAAIAVEPAVDGGAAGSVAPPPDHEQHEELTNALLVFLGETWERVDGADLTEKGFTFGLEYSRDVSDRFAVGGVLERAGGEIRGTLLLAQVYFKVAGRLFLVTGPGVEFRDAYEGHHGEAEQHGALTVVRGAHDIEQMLRERDTTVFVYRIGVAYEINMGRWILAPAVDLDFVGRDEALVIGGLFGFEF